MNICPSRKLQRKLSFFKLLKLRDEFSFLSSGERGSNWIKYPRWEIIFRSKIDVQPKSELEFHRQGALNDSVDLRKTFSRNQFKHRLRTTFWSIGGCLCITLAFVYLRHLVPRTCSLSAFPNWSHFYKSSEIITITILLKPSKSQALRLCLNNEMSGKLSEICSYFCQTIMHWIFRFSNSPLCQAASNRFKQK